MNRNQLKWRCRRGMRELDALMTGYLGAHYASVDDAEKRGFERLLELPDPVLVGYLLKGEQPDDPDIGRVIRRILG
ncbi:MAG: succinate dehydrogenase assembly factor 2 [Pseudomonadota bacterium]